MRQAHPHTLVQNLRFALRVVWLLIRGFALACALLLAALMLFVWYLPRFVNNQRFRPVIQAQLEKLLQRPVGLGGVIVTPQGVKLNGVRVEAKDGSGRAILESQYALVTIKMRPLLQEKRLEIGQVKFVQPTIHLWRDKDGQWNIADLFTSTETVQAPQLGRFSLPVSLSADNTIIENGELQIEDQLNNTRYSVKRLNMTLHKFSVEKPFAFSMEFDSQVRLGKRDLDDTVALDGSASLADFDWRQAYVRAEKLDVQVDGIPVRGSGGAAGFPMTSVDLDVALPAFGPKEWQTYLGKELDLQVPASHWKAKARLLDSRRVRVDALQASAGPLSASASGLVDVSTGHPHVDADLVVPDFPMTEASSFHKAFGRFRFKGAASGQASVTGWVDKLVVHRARVHWTDLGFAVKRATVTKGTADLAISADFDHLSLAASGGAFSALSNAFSSVDLSVDLKGKNLKVDKLALRWGDSHIRLKGHIVNLSNPKEVEIAGYADRLRWETTEALADAIIAAFPATTPARPQPYAAPEKTWVQTFKYAIPRRFPDSVGHIRVADITHKNFSFKDTDILWDLHGVTPSLKRVGGDIRVGFGPGSIDDMKAVEASNKFLGIVFLPYIYMHKMNSLSVLAAAEAYPNKFDFNRIEGQYSIEKGVLSTKFFHVDSPQLVAYADGTADFGKEIVDMDILTRLTSYRAPLPEWWVDELGRPAIGFRVKGDLNMPDLEPHLHKMAADEIEKMLAEGQTRAKARFETIEKLETP